MTRIERDRNKARAKERKKRGSRKYGQAKLKASRRGITSLILAVMTAAVLAGLVMIAYTTKGKAASYVGGVGLTAFLCSVAGLVTACKGFKERDRRYFTCKLGIGLHLLVIAGYAAIFLRGLL
ncbi:MAG TPA: hypothetical protein DCZ20_10270 [Lachnospiraceae bacterium]|nr:hypothetical protein [Lachnospiraceae bacterium]